MKVVHCSTGVSFSSANYRMHLALLNNGVQSDILTLYKNSNNMINVHDIAEYGKNYAIYQKLAYYLNIFEYCFLDRIAGLMEGMLFTTGRIGVDICNIPLIKNADIVHIHCINRGFLSLSSIKKIIQLNKPVIITLHDSWMLTGGCHVLNGCARFTSGCYMCPQLKKMKNVVQLFINRKRRLFKDSNIVLTAPSVWTRNNAQRSIVTKDRKCVVIGNTLDFSVFSIMNEINIKNILGRNKKRKISLLFGSLNSTKTPYKGFDYLIELLKEIINVNSKLVENIELNIFGATESSNQVLKKFHCCFWGYIENEKKLAALYNMCDIYIVPSLEDSFNQTVLESCACGTPVVSFNTGGIADILIHKVTGYLAEYKNSKDLYKGIQWVLNNNQNNKIGVTARNYVMSQYSPEIIAKKYIDLYEKNPKSNFLFDDM